MRPSYSLLSSLLALLSLPAGCSSSTSTSMPDQGTPDSGQASDPVTTSFAFMGCNRLEFADWNPAGNPSSANQPQLTQSFHDLVALTPLPSHLLFIGDLVLNEAGDNGVTLNGQLAGWSQLVKSDASKIADKLTLLPVVGNHETLKSAGGTEVPDLPTYAVWSSWQTTNGFDPPRSNGPTTAAPNLDSLTIDQSKFTYSFDVGANHLIVINTDTPTTSNTAGQIPYNWIASDVTQAQANSAVSNIFLLGHKPIADTLNSSDNQRVIDPPLGAKLQTLMDSNKKVRAYLAAHDHTWSSRTLGTTTVTQVIAGNAGSKINPLFSISTAGNPYYGFTVVQVHKSGSVGLVSYQRPVPSPYNGPTQAAQPQPEALLPAR